MSSLLTLIPFPYRILALALLAAALFGFGYVKGAAHAEGKLAAFTAETRTAGEIAQKAADVQKAKDQQRKDASDASYTKALVLLSADNKRMLDTRSTGDYLPAAAANSRSPETACFDRGKLQQALRRLDEGVSGLVGEGDEARLRLDTAIRWANQ